ncbi:hypothetical protein SGGMMB4_04983 [Sodalis glossinidius str. 'morsitans']|uniref:Lipoprotein n=1 Tax=Sodalis glossinidius (strain morsitans) TaxID=343509 RepID=A0A193QML3_SODGM|nr:hypothetical protein SGGMMB4_04983 [Sodalis glossinidius str. 'morsitans']
MRQLFMFLGIVFLNAALSGCLWPPPGGGGWGGGGGPHWRTTTLTCPARAFSFPAAGGSLKFGLTKGRSRQTPLPTCRFAIYCALSSRDKTKTR